MKILVTGASGQVGRFVSAALAEAGHLVVAAGRQPPTGAADFRPFSLEPDSIGPSRLAGIDALVHCAFHHVPGRYRGGEGDDPATFVRRNRDGTARLFEVAKASGVRRAVFISSRAVYGPHPPGTVLSEGMACRPDSLYGQVKLAGEAALNRLASPDFVAATLRPTGIFGLPGQLRRLDTSHLPDLVRDLLDRPQERHKWSRLFEDYLGGRPVPPRVATEVHGDRVAGAVLVLFAAPAAAINGQAFNLSDGLVDRRDLLAIVRSVRASPHPLPARADASGVNAMSQEKIDALMREIETRPGPSAVV